MENNISVVIPCKDRERSILRCLKSVYAQTLSPYEVIMVDDGSSDATVENVKKDFPDVVIISNKESKGGAMARNQGASRATGQFIAFLDSDDAWLPDHLLSKITLLKSGSVDAAFGNFVLVKGTEEIRIDFKESYTGNLNIGNLILSAKRFDARTSTFVFKREAFMRVKFDEKLKKHQDWDLAINFDENFNWVQDFEPTVRILVEQGEARMSQKLQHESSFYFLDKNFDKLKADNLFMFCLKQIVRSQIAKDDQAISKQYLMKIEPLYDNLQLKNKVLYTALKYNLLNVASIYKVLSKFR